MADAVRKLKAQIELEAKGGDKTAATLDKVAESISGINEAAGKQTIGKQFDFKAAAKSATQLRNELGLTRQELLTLNFTIGDIVASLASGASPFTVLLQQGGQVRDGFGSFSNLLTRLLPLLARFAPVIAGIGGAIAAVSFVKFGQGAAQAAEDMDRLASKSGLTLEAFQRFEGIGAAKGVDTASLATGFKAIVDSASQGANAIAEFEDKVAQARNSFTGFISDQSLAKEVQERNKVSLRATGDVWRDLGIDIRNFTGSADDAERLILRISDVLNRGGNSPRFLAGVRELTALVGSDVVRALRSGRAEIDKYAKELDAIAPGFSKRVTAEAKAYEESVRVYEAANTRLKNSFNAIFIPASTAVQDFFSRWLETTAPKIDALRERLQPAANAFRDFIRILAGDQATAQANPTLRILAKVVEGIATAFVVAKDVIVGVFDTISSVAKGVAEEINSIFGTNWNAATVLAVAAILKLLNPLGKLKTAFEILVGIPSLIGKAFDAAAGKVTKGLDLIGAAFSSPLLKVGLVVAGFALLGAAVYLYRDKVLKVAELTGLAWDITAKQIDYAIAKYGALTSKIFGTDEEVQRNLDAASKAMTDRVALQDRFAKIWADEGKYAGQSFSDALKSRLSEAGEEVSSAFSAVGVKIANALKPGQDALQSFFGGIKDTTAEANKAANAVNNIGVIRGGVRGEAPVDRYFRSVKQFSRAVDEANSKEIGVRVIRGGAETIQTLTRRTEEFAAAKQKATADVSGLPEQAAGFRSIEIDGVERLGKVSEDTNRKRIEGSKQAADAEQQAKAAYDASNESIRRQKELQAQQITAPTDVAAAATPAPSPVTDVVQRANEQINALIAALKRAIDDAQLYATSAVSLVGNAVIDLTGAATTSINTLISALGRAIGQVRALAESLSALPSFPDYGGSNQGGGGSSGVLAAATGGLVLGPGTATSDSIPAWLSTGEFVVRAAAVKRYGLDLFRRLNGMSLGALNVKAPKFATGGLVGRLPAPVSGSSGGRSLTIVLDGKTFSGLNGPASVVDQLERAAMTQRISATTRRAPGRIG